MPLPVQHEHTADSGSCLGGQFAELTLSGGTPHKHACTIKTARLTEQGQIAGFTEERGESGDGSC
jgi:hypothetical protein